MADFVYCVLGATGFLGRHLLQRLAMSTARPIRCLSRRQRAPANSIEWLVGDLHEERALRRLVVKDSIVINLAFDAKATRLVNVSAARTLGKICVGARARRLVHLSTATVVGRAPGDLVDETTPCEPGSDYELTKLNIEQALLAETGHKVGTTIIRPTAVFGEGGRNLLKLAQLVARGNPVQRRLMTYLQGARCMNLVALENVIGAIAHLALEPADVCQGCFIVSDDDSRNNNYAYVESRFAGAFGKCSPGPVVAQLPEPLLRVLLRLRGRSSSKRYRRYSCEKLLATGFKRPVTFESALDDYADFLASQWAADRHITG